jgi:FkbM family methyltransferase
MTGLKNALYGCFQRVVRLLWGTGLGRVPGAYAVHGFLFQLLQPGRDVIDVQGSKMYVNPRGLPQTFRRTFQSYIVSSGWEDLTTQMYKEVIREGDVVLDLGANIGYYTLLAARLTGPKGRVYAFEPEPLNYGLLLKNVELNGYDNVVARQQAVSDKVGRVRFFLDGENTGAHTMYQHEGGHNFIEVESVTLDDFFKDRDNRVDVVKMDIEGAEMAALAGMERVIRDNAGIKIFMEFYFPGIKRSGSSPEAFVRRLLEDYHFSVLAIGEYTRDKKYLKINSADELMRLCDNKKTANLFLEKKGERSRREG